MLARQRDRRTAIGEVARVLKQLALLRERLPQSGFEAPHGRVQHDGLALPVEKPAADLRLDRVHPAGEGGL